MHNGPIWSLPGALLSGTAAAGGIALISSVAFMGGFIGPNIVGASSDVSDGYTAGLTMLAGLALAASGLAQKHEGAIPLWVVRVKACHTISGPRGDTTVLPASSTV